jgi:hypothetical protein
MNTFALLKYAPEHKSIWDDVVLKSKNGNFLHMRDYMDYHAHRFNDYSVIVLKQDKPIAVFPCNRVDDQVVSHGGLTYGGIICDTEMKASAMLVIFDALLKNLKSDGIRRLTYKPIPHIFHRYPSEEDLYALYRSGARLVRRDASSAIALPERLKFAKGKREGVRKAQRQGVRVERCTDFNSFFEIGRQIMQAKYDREPVHTASEMVLLQQSFPVAIQFHAAFDGSAMLAGVITYNCKPAMHIQYMYSSPEGQQVGALDLVLQHVIECHTEGLHYVSFGVSTEDEGRYLNEGLIHQKEMFGARTVVHDFYEIDIC